MFATDTERAFSVLLDALGLTWEYEPQEFQFPNGNSHIGFRPDFYIKELDVYVELTTAKTNQTKNRKLRLMAEHYPDIQVRLLGRKELELFTATSC